MIGIVQEYRAKRTLDRLALLIAPRATVRRDGATVEILADDVVPDDIVELQPGDQVVADGELVEARRVGVDDEGRQALGPRRLAGAGKQHVLMGDAAVGDPGLLAVEPDVTVAVGLGGHRERGDIGPRLRLGQRECGNRLAVTHRRQIALLDLV